MKFKRIYGFRNVSNLTLNEVNEFIESEGINYAGDYGFKVDKCVKLIFSRN